MFLSSSPQIFATSISLPSTPFFSPKSKASKTQNNKWKRIKDVEPEYYGPICGLCSRDWRKLKKLSEILETFSYFSTGPSLSLQPQRQTWPECTVRPSLSLSLCHSFSKRKLQKAQENEIQIKDEQTHGRSVPSAHTSQEAQQMNEIFSRFSHFCRVLYPAPCNHRRRRRRSSGAAGSSTIRFESEKDACPVCTYTLLVATTTTRELFAYTFSKKHMCSFTFFSLFFSFCFSPLFIREESRSEQKRTETAHPKAWSPRCCCRLLHPGTKIARL